MKRTLKYLVVHCRVDALLFRSICASRFRGCTPEACVRCGLALVALLLWSVGALAQNASYIANALTNTAVTVKAAPGQLIGVRCHNTDAGVRWVQVYDATGAVVVGTTVAKVSVPLPASTAASVDVNVTFTNGIKAAATTTQTGGTAPSVPLVCDVIFR